MSQIPRRVTRGAIAAGHSLSVEAGMEMFRLGGNAFDAVAAAACTSFAAEPMLTSPAGGGFLLAHPQSGQDVLFDFFTQTPCQKRDPAEVNFYPVIVDFGGVLQEFHIGLGSIATPGMMAGLFRVQQHLGRLPWSVVLEPAIHLARQGIEVTPFQAYNLKILSPIVLASTAAQALYAPGGNLLQAGDRMVLSDLADSLSEMALKGVDLFYRGEMGQQIVKDCQAQGGYLTRTDLEQYQVIERKPLRTDYRGNTVLTNPPPSAGGTLIAFALRLLEQIDLSQFKFGSIAHLRILAETMRLTNLVRQAGYDEQLDQPNFADRFLSREHLEEYGQPLQAIAGLGNVNLGNVNLGNVNLGDVNKRGSTTHVSAIDEDGNAASMTSSNGEGSSYVIPGTGIMMNNMLGEADLHPNGFHQWRENIRIASMMAPTIILQNNQPAIVLGSGGSNRIRTAILQVISNLLDFQMPIAQAVSSPRVHWEAGVFNLEPGFPDAGDDRTFPFDNVVERWQAQNMFYGGVHAVTHSLDGFAGAGDSRRSGEVGVQNE
ncbi:gamma-glutamyltransferase [Leptolyngbya ohadii]|uniref:gamma-glutamyltransferase n=1 Tax=Leptolyngbya ohadii TaxID=1962290 RepID=UPI000B59A5F5|nr:gamma-glutamyltransferase [Leptolyngbya ohadii]